MRTLVRPGDEGGEEERYHPEGQQDDDNDGQSAFHASRITENRFKANAAP